MICINCNNEVDSKAKFCTNCGNKLNQDKKEKNNIKLIGIICLSVLIIGIILFIIFFPKKPKDIYEILDNMIELNSYENFNGFIIYDNAKGKEKEDLKNKISVGNKIDIIEDLQWEQITYRYNNKDIKNSTTSGKQIYYYADYKIYHYDELYDSIFEELKKYKYKYNKNSYEFINEKYEDEYGDEWYTLLDLEYGLEGYLENAIGYEPDLEVCTEIGCYEQVPEIQGVKIKVTGNYITEISLNYDVECFDENEDWYSCKDAGIKDKDTFKIVLRFSKHNKMKVELPKEVKKSLKDLEESGLEGIYKGNIVCPDGNSYEESLELTNDYEADEYYSGWKIKMKGYSCKYNQYNNLEEVYQVENDKVKVYDIFGNLLVEFVYKDGKIIEYDENNNVITTFIKEK